MAFHLNIAGIQGEDTAQGFTNQVQVLSFGFSYANPTTVTSAGGSSATKCMASEVQCAIVFDKSTKNFFQNVTNGTHAATAVISGQKSGGNATLGKPYITWTFTEVLITSMSLSGGGEDYPSSVITFSYGKATVNYSQQKPDGSLTSTGDASFDFLANQGQ
jgi:type VI secretion system secreted protein Hcp